MIKLGDRPVGGIFDLDSRGVPGGDPDALAGVVLE